jgi:hypothetical protein
MRREASRELLASRDDVWSFLAEPYHLADWWPRLRAVRPDRRGFAPGARWEVDRLEQLPLLAWRDKRPSLLLIDELVPPERWTFHLMGVTPLDVEVSLAAATPDRTVATVGVSGSPLAGPGKLARRAVDRLYDLCQTAAGL